MEILVINNYKTVADIELSFKSIFNKNKIREIDKECGRILRNKKLAKIAIISLGIILYITSPTFVYAGGFVTLGNKFWDYVRIFARYGCLIMCGVDIMKNLNAGDTKSIAKVVFKYILAYMTVIGLPWVFNEIDAAFSSM